MLIFRGTILTTLFLLLAILPTQFTNAAVFSIGPALTTVENSALIIVAGRKLEDDNLQTNIHNVTNEFYRSAQRNGYGDNDIYYLATDSGLTGYDAASNLANLEFAIADWASQRLQTGGFLSIYMFSYGDPDKFYVDSVSDQTLTPLDLDSWLSALEGKVTGVEINVIIEAGESGSFISAANGRIGRAGRVVITSASDDGPSYSSSSGALFSDKIVTLLNQGSDLAASFTGTKSSVQSISDTPILQDPWIDADGDGVHNEPDDLTIASKRKFFSNNQSPPTLTPTPTYTSTPTYTPTPDPSIIGNSCGHAIKVPTNGVPLDHSFEDLTDLEWFVFDGKEAKDYVIDIQVPPDSFADVSLELHRECQNGIPEDKYESFGTGVRQKFTAPFTGSIYLRLSNEENSPAGLGMHYNLSVQELKPEKGAVIIVAGRVKNEDKLQKNIHEMTNQVFNMYGERGYSTEDIHYLATVSGLPGYDGQATIENLDKAITEWAFGRIKLNEISDVLTLYIMDHGDKDLIYLDKPGGQLLTPSQLDGWLNELEALVPGVKINVIIEACHSGSFIQESDRVDGRDSISKPGRVIITSSNQEGKAYASHKGAHFSDHFFTAIKQEINLYSSWLYAQSLIRPLFLSQQEPWLDGNGNGIPNELADKEEAALRGFGYVGTFSDGSFSPPYITEADVSESLDSTNGVITAEVHTDDEANDGSEKTVWAVLYPPSYDPPESGDELTAEPEGSLVELTAKGDNRYEGTFNFTEPGTYRIVIYANDVNNLSAQPQVVTFESPGSTGTGVVLENPGPKKVYLPFISR